MTDRYQEIRAALTKGPTPGPWYWIGDSLTHRQFNIYAINGTDKHIATVNDLPVEKLWARDQVESEATAKLIAACDPDTIRELLAERDALREALETMVEMVEMNGFGRAYAMDIARAALAEEKPNG
jgi:hypothetical protein